MNVLKIIAILITPHPPLRAPSPTRGEGTFQSSVAFHNKAYFIALNFIPAADVPISWPSPLVGEVARKGG